ncbi:MAG TPA: hypothetical protein VJ224_02125 [Thermoplasmata archaeon]|nr:hypothetical protein [Thermoplasmata archaeon]
MPAEKRQSGMLKPRIVPEHLELVKDDPGLDVSTFVRWCVLTGSVLGDPDALIRSKMGRGP